MSTSTENKTHYQAIAYTATFLGILLALFLLVVFTTPSKSNQETVFYVESEPVGNFTKEDSQFPDNLKSSSSSTTPNAHSDIPVVTDNKETLTAIDSIPVTKKNEFISEEQPSLNPNLKSILQKANIKHGRNTEKNEPTGNTEEYGISGINANISYKTKEQKPYELSGRTLLKMPSQINNIAEEGTVIVEILVDKKGKVIKAVPGQRGSTTTSARLYAIAVQKVKEVEFNHAPEGVEEQRGTYTFVFRLE